MSIEVSYFSNGDIMQSQVKCIKQLHVGFGMEHANAISTPMSLSINFSIYIGDTFEHPNNVL